MAPSNTNNRYGIGGPANFYKCFSSAVLICEWMLAPVLFYIILKKSKNLGNFKWLILNHAVWSLMTSTMVCVLKPVLLSPAAGGFGIGVFQNMDVKWSIACFIIGFGFLCNCFFGLALTLVNRYTVAFCSLTWKRLFWTKKFWAVVVVLHVMFFALIIYACLVLFTFNHETIVQWSIDFDPQLEQFANEESLLVVDQAYVRYPLYLISGTIVLFYLGSAFIICFFIVKIRSKTSSQVFASKIQRSLIISSVMQILLTNIFAITPVFVYMMSLAFNIPNMANLQMWLMSLFASHCIFDFVATVYFVPPYRRYVAEALHLSRGWQASLTATVKPNSYF